MFGIHSPCRAAVVAIEHRGDGIDAQPVDVEMLQPVERAGDQKALHLAAAEIVDAGVPVVVKAFARIGMLVERRAVEARQAVRIGGKMRRHPVEDDADAGARGSASTKRAKPSRRAEAAGRREQAERLIAPGAAERMFGDRHQLDMGEAHLDDDRAPAARPATSQSRAVAAVRPACSQEPRCTS